MNPGNTRYRFAAGVALAAAFVLVWLSLGVGIIGRDGARADAPERVLRRAVPRISVAVSSCCRVYAVRRASTASLSA